jgi:beta-glucanase (GH16 family)
MNINNKLNIQKIFIASSLILTIGCSNSDKQTVTTLNKLVLEENFDLAGAPNSTLWTNNIGTGNNGWGNDELQYYTNRTQNVRVEDGLLKITAIKETYMGAAYTSGRILTKGKFEQKYGRFEARIKMPWGKGLWPAFWMLGANSDTVSWPQCGEIDIMEFLGNKPTSIFGTVHGPGYSGGNAISKTFVLPNDRFDNDFHIFGIEWGENYINYYVDGYLYNQITPKDVPGEWVFNQPFYIILNMAVGGNFPGNPNSETIFPQTMLVDYVRVYQ